MSLAPEARAAVEHERDTHPTARSAMLPALKAVQAAHGWVSDDHLAEAAAILGVTTAEMDDLATFYSLIFRRPVGERLVLLCDGVSCMLNGGDEVAAALRARHGIGYGETTPDGRLTLVNICCVGRCDLAPAALVGPDRDVVGPLDPADLSALEGS
ncbi:MAG: NADH-quinone oxidoreductase subunit NuoE [Paracoccaceae bacterium]